MASRKGNFREYDNGGADAGGAMESIAAPNMEMREDAGDYSIANHLGSEKVTSHNMPNVETRNIVIPVSRSLEDLEQGKVDIYIGEMNAATFRRPVFNKETQQVVHTGDVKRSQVTAVTLRMFDNQLPVLVGAKFRSSKGDLSVKSSHLKYINGRGYPVYFKAETEVVFSILPEPLNDGIMLYENGNLVDDYLIKTYGGIQPEELDAGFTPNPTEPGMLNFEYAKNPLMTNLLKKHRYELEKEFPQFDYKRMKKDAEKYGRNAVQVPKEAVEKIKRDIAEHAIAPIEEGTGDLAKAALRLEWPMGENGSFSGVRAYMKKRLGLDDGAVDVLMHQKHDLTVELLISAVIPGAAQP